MDAAEGTGAPLTLGYWGIRGLGAPLRMIFAYTSTPYKEKRYAGGADWFAQDKPVLAQRNSMINLPYIIDGDLVVTQSNACLRYVGAKVGIDGRSPRESVLNDQVLCQVMDLRNAVIALTYMNWGAKPKAEFPAELAKHVAGPMAAHYTKLEGFFHGEFLCGAAPCSGDFHAWEMLDQHEIMCARLGIASPLGGGAFPRLAAFHARVRALPQLAAYFAGGDSRLACNFPGYSHFTGLPGDWGDVSAAPATGQ